MLRWIKSIGEAVDKFIDAHSPFQVEGVLFTKSSDIPGPWQYGYKHYCGHVGFSTPDPCGSCGGRNPTYKKIVARKVSWFIGGCCFSRTEEHPHDR